MKKKFFLILSILLISLAYADSSAPITSARGNLTVNISGIVGDQGVIRFALFNSKESYDYSDKYNVMPPFYKTTTNQISSDGTATIVVQNIPYGEYAFKLFHDKDNSGKLPETWSGTPKEEVGFSNNADAKNGKPRYFQVKFKFDANHTVQDIKMQSFK